MTRRDGCLATLFLLVPACSLLVDLDGISEAATQDGASSGSEEPEAGSGGGADGGVEAGVLLRRATFESGALADPTVGADWAVGQVSLESTNPLVGKHSARVVGAIGGVDGELGFDLDRPRSIVTTFVLRVEAFPSGSLRIVRFTSGGETESGFSLDERGKLRLASQAEVSAWSSPLTLHTPYVVRIRHGGAPAVIDATVMRAGQPDDVDLIDPIPVRADVDGLIFGQTVGTNHGMSIVLDDITVEEL